MDSDNDIVFLVMHEPCCAIFDCYSRGIRKVESIKSESWKLKNNHEYICEAHYRRDLRIFKSMSKRKAQVKCISEVETKIPPQMILRKGIEKQKKTIVGSQRIDMANKIQKTREISKNVWETLSLLDTLKNEEAFECKRFKELVDCACSLHYWEQGVEVK